MERGDADDMSVGDAITYRRLLSDIPAGMKTCATTQTSSSPGERPAGNALRSGSVIIEPW
ncbi:hypothetical protein RISK_000508 [Rhodopirellula islandica]|uniref:Uncharacterized protein n=1 Tax=Rhodopirellula islandica TaxID=595434 RepID=A0A0J1BLP5_RHOIS|nr:hypothetical protein RISK_000508 [Rhodopirellula islandica]